MEFYKETDYQASSFAKIPKDWKRARLEDVLDSFQTGIWGGESVQGRRSFPVIRSTEITYDGRIDPSSAAWRDIPEKKIEKYKLQDGDILLVASSGSSHLIGRAAIYKQLESKQTYLFSNFMIRIRPADVNPAFLYYCLRCSQYHEYLKQLQQTSTGLRNLPRKEILLFELPFPSRIEQDKIVYVLDIIDKLIQQTDTIIQKTQELKKGLMQELLTKGIGHKEFKYSEELGCEIPKEWEVVEIGELIEEIKNGFASGKRDEEGIVQVRMNNVTTDGRLIFDSYLKVPKPDDLNEWLLKSRDFLFNNTNSIDLVGKSAIFYSAPFPCTFSNHFTRIRFNEAKILPEMVLFKFLILWERDYFKSVAIRHVGQSAVHGDYLKKIKIALPPLREQQNIVSILININRNIEQERENKIKLETLKKGLMQILLTGQVRVKVD